MTGQDLIHQIDQATERTGVRSSMIDRVKQEIAAGTYDTPEKLAHAQECIQEVLAESLMS